MHGVRSGEKLDEETPRCFKSLLPAGWHTVTAFAEFVITPRIRKIELQKMSRTVQGAQSDKDILRKMNGNVYFTVIFKFQYS